MEDDDNLMVRFLLKMSWGLLIAGPFLLYVWLADPYAAADKIFAGICIIYIAIYILLWTGVGMYYAIKRMIGVIAGNAIHKDKQGSPFLNEDIRNLGDISGLIRKRQLKFRELDILEDEDFEKYSKNVRITVQNKLRYPASVHVSEGTCIALPKSKAYLIVACPEDVTLQARERKAFFLTAVCTGLEPLLPGSTTKFSILSNPISTELPGLMKTLNRARVSVAVIQAAIWIVVDDAGFHEILGTFTKMEIWKNLFSKPAMSVHPPVYEIVHALRICDWTGIDISGKRLLKDKPGILNQWAEDRSVLRQWLLYR